MQELKVYNTRTRSVEPISSGENRQVKFYCCGPTVHDFAHIGNLRTFTAVDIFRRVLVYFGYDPYHVMNITDIEDKIIRRSQESGMSAKAYTEKYTQEFFTDLETLNILPAHRNPRATDQEVMDKMAELVEYYLDNDIAYQTEDGSVYFKIDSFPTYGDFAGIDVSELQAGARVCHDEYEKDSACDFAVWKAWVPEDGDVYWDQYPRLGKGRPGWHLECSAMGLIYLGDSFDVHLGGVDLVFPHHQNEIAQSEAFTGKRFANSWVHVQHLYVEGEKMSKSLGNFFTLRDLMDAAHNPAGKAWDPMTIRWALLRVAYDTRLNFTFKELASAEQNIERVLQFMRRAQALRAEAGEEDNRVLAWLEETKLDIDKALSTNLNTAEAIGVMFEFITKVNPLLDKPKALSQQCAEQLVAYFFTLDQVFGCRWREQLSQGSEFTSEELALVEQRQQARATKNWAESDRIRDLLAEQGLVVEDTAAGPRLKRI